MGKDVRIQGQPDQDHPLELSIRVAIQDVHRGGGGLNLSWNGYAEQMDFQEAARLMARFHELIQEMKR